MSVNSFVSLVKFLRHSGEALNHVVIHAQACFAGAALKQAEAMLCSETNPAVAFKGDDIFCFVAIEPNQNVRSVK